MVRSTEKGVQFPGYPGVQAMNSCVSCVSKNPHWLEKEDVKRAGKVGGWIYDYLDKKISNFYFCLPVPFNFSMFSHELNFLQPNSLLCPPGKFHIAHICRQNHTGLEHTRLQIWSEQKGMRLRKLYASLLSSNTHPCICVPGHAVSFTAPSSSSTDQMDLV